MTKAGITNISGHKKNDRPTKFQRSSSAGFLLYHDNPDPLAFSRPLNKSSSDIANEEIALWRMRLQAMLSHKNPLTELRRASSVVPCIALLRRKVLAVPATFADPEHMFSSASNIMTKKRVRLSCDHLEELMYLHEVWPKVREWTAIKKTRLA